MSAAPRLYSLTIKLAAGVDEARAGSFSSLYSERALASSLFHENHDESKPLVWQWLFNENIAARSALALVESEGLRALVDEVSAEPVEERNWLEYVYEQHPPFSIGRFYLHGAHSAPRPEQGQIALQIDAVTAFGSGTHGTTEGCLKALEWLDEQGAEPENILDIGTGSGILAIAAWKLWARSVTASDIDEEAVRVAARHRDINRVPDEAVRCIVSDGFENVAGSYDLVIANILAAPLQDLAEDIARACFPGGYAVLSGMLEEQCPLVIDRYRAYGFIEEKRFTIGRWMTVVLRSGQAAA